MKFGIDRLLADPALREPLEGRRVALVAHPASVTESLVHSLDALAGAGVNLTSAFGPQHGLKGDKQDNMVETADELDPALGIPVFSLYGQVRRPTSEMMATADVFLFDLQDLGCRIYTFVTTLLYLLQAASGTGKAVWVLDRPNPAGRPIEGTLLIPGQESFVGAGPMPMRHGLTLGEMGLWFIRQFNLDVDYRVVTMEGWQPSGSPGFGWPDDRVWINPSPNAANLNMARAYAGTVMLEGTTLSEGRGTTRPLEVLFGAPDLPAGAVHAQMQRLAPEWLAGCAIRECWFEPTFHKHQGTLCNALMIHAEGQFYRHEAFRPWRLQALAFKAIRQLRPDYPIWRDFPYEYEFDRLAIDVINGGPALREWVDDPAAEPGDFDALATRDEAAWREEIAPILLYT
ncbi:exo-beta-N-acetylmuramidase NamZ domain-containing protein [Novosphingobium sp. M1R2S20]|uniref:Exo-beta-N-acetylmuramidase NamZ domain-containing protein n=1 Tax=Novosphingobium rhizovicinum TaxID=3228928 RepID=A0ABV3RFD6_9SPHN